MKLRKLSLRDRRIFERYLAYSVHTLSVFSFTDIFIWEGLFDIRWQIIDGSLCIFFRDNTGMFLYLPPLGKKITEVVLRKAFDIMDGANRNKDISRIENAEEKDLPFFEKAGYSTRKKSCDYLFLRKKLISLGGSSFKSKRWALNYFIKHNEFDYVNFSPREHKEDCLELYKLWAGWRIKNNADVVYQGMIRDSLNALEVLLENYTKLDCIGRAVRICGEIRAFSFGYALNKETFCILYEITDLSAKGLAQFIFRAFCAELAQYEYINIMDDSGLENLRKVKLSYRPERLVPAYIVKRAF